MCARCEYDLCRECATRLPHIVFSAHGDTCFGESACTLVPGSQDALYFGHVDNFAGVYAMMTAHFSGRLPPKRVQCQITYGEESQDFAGAEEVMEKLRPHDFVVVIDVTGQSARSVDRDNVSNASNLIGHVVFEKVKHNENVMRLLMRLPGRLLTVDGCDAIPCDDPTPPPYTYEIWHGCNDPQASEDESDAYGRTQKDVVFLGVPTSGGRHADLKSDGDYNDGPVFCWKKDVEAVTHVVIDLANLFLCVTP